MGDVSEIVDEIRSGQRELPTWDEMREIACESAQSRGEWSGVPLPIYSSPLAISERFGYQGLNGFKLDEPDADPKKIDDDTRTAIIDAAKAIVGGVKVVNSWWSYHHQATVYVVKVGNKIRGRLHRDNLPGESVRRHMVGFEVAQVQDAKAELKAMDKLSQLIKPHLFDSYILNGMFLETSPRSRITYLFRKNRPTLALRADATGTRVLCGLCLHGIGWYQDTFYGAMVPTDDVITQLIYMRSNEHFYWRKANQHSIYEWQCDL